MESTYQIVIILQIFVLNILEAVRKDLLVVLNAIRKARVYIIVMQVL